jgi:DNA invertase Pin-like site-specific DNA recombinase
MPKGELQGMRIGYARVSTRDQNLEMQLDALNKAGCKRTFTEELRNEKSIKIPIFPTRLF